ncbi:MAG: hypothetical protein FJ272_02305 [Planctomycetes bacterium]|nr:hypothetical protein [Planctomycetota bacterium]MBM4083596.1 hypothetical protein [Planctomycetota bacterium]
MLKVLLTILLLAAEPMGPPKRAATIGFPGLVLGDIDKIGFREPSGIAYHPIRRTLFVVGDGGDIEEISKDGATLRTKHMDMASRDFEGITVNPKTGLLYVVVESSARILEIDPFNFEVKREFKVDRRFGPDAAELFSVAGNGVEGITFVPDDKHPEGGTFFLVNQLSPPIVIEVSAPLVSSKLPKASARILKWFSLGVSDLSGIHYDAKSGHLFVIADGPNLFLEVTRDGEILREYALPGNDQEGITLDDEDFLYIAQDSGGILKLKYDRPRK